MEAWYTAHHFLYTAKWTGPDCLSPHQ